MAISIGKIERKKSYMLIIDQLKHLISTGELQIGDKLPPERVLAQEFGVARPTVREALSALEVLGIIDVQVGSGAYVMQVPQDEAPQTLLQLEEESSPPELFEVRLAIEPLSAAKAAENATEQDLAQLRTIVSEMEQDVQQDIFSLEKDRQFHRCLAQASNNVHVLEIMKYVISVMQKPVWQKYIMKNIAIEGHKERYVQNHRRILDAIEKRDPERAQAAMREHLQGGILLDDWDQ